MDKPIYIWKVGSDERPATDEDLQEMEKYIAEKIPSGDHVVLHHAVELSAIINKDVDVVILDSDIDIL